MVWKRSMKAQISTVVYVYATHEQYLVLHPGSRLS